MSAAAERDMSGLGGRVGRAVAGLAPGYFALVMASGILSIGMRLKGFTMLSDVLLAATALGFVTLLVLLLWRLLRHRVAVSTDFTDPRRGFGFFTLVAGTNVLSARLTLAQHHLFAAVLLVIGVVLWLVLGYVVPWTAVLHTHHRPVLADANGTWFIWAVASQSVAVAAAALEPIHGSTQHLLAVLAVFSWSVGIFLYAGVGVLVAARMLLYELRPDDLIPSYWVAMGASAISVTAGAQILRMADAPMLSVTHGLVAGTSVLFWAFATWLIPPLVAAGGWRHVARRVPLTYEAGWWAIVFPLGMYAVASIGLGQADHLSLLGHIGSVELWAALAAWLWAAAAMVLHLRRTVLARPS